MEIYKENRPWGDFERFTHNEASTVKVITVKSGEAFSLQTHAQRDEFWKLLSDGGMIEIGDKKVEGKKGDEFFIKAGTRHRVTGPAEFLEIALGNFDEKDIVRLEDKYHR